MSERPKGKSKGKGKIKAAGKGPSTTKSTSGYSRSGRRDRGNRRHEAACESSGYHNAAEEWPRLNGAEESWSGPAAPWPPQDPAWWAALASHLPAAWGKGGLPAITAVRMDGLDCALHQTPAPGGAAASDDGQDNESQAEAATESVLDALAPSGKQSGSPQSAAQSSASRPSAAGAAGGKHWVIAEGRLPDELGERYLAAENLFGAWVDSQGSTVQVVSTDAYNVRVLATMSRPGRPDMFLAVKPIRMGAGWQCGHYILDESWSTKSQLHWVAGDGRVSVWVRPQERPASTDAVGDDGDDTAVDDSKKDVELTQKYANTKQSENDEQAQD